MNRRAVVAGTGTMLVGLAGCTSNTSSASLAHTVSVYLSERDETHDVTVLIKNEQQETLFQRAYRLAEAAELPCEGENRSGVEIYVGTDADGSPDLRLDANCQSITMD